MFYFRLGTKCKKYIRMVVFLFFSDQALTFSGRDTKKRPISFFASAQNLKISNFTRTSVHKNSLHNAAIKLRPHTAIQNRASQAG